MRGLSLLSLLLSACLSPATSHYLWAEIQDDGITVTFSEKPGVYDDILKVLNGRVDRIYVERASKGGGGDDDVLMDDDGTSNKHILDLEDMGDHLFAEMNNANGGGGGRALWATNFFDYGPFPDKNPPPDLQYTFSAQVFSQENDFNDFFATRPVEHFSVIMKSCGPPYKIAILGVEATTSVDVCLYYKGGILIGCTSNKNFEGDTMEIDGFGHGGTGKMVYALANATLFDDFNRTTIAFTSTSVYIDHPCAT